MAARSCLFASNPIIASHERNRRTSHPAHGGFCMIQGSVVKRVQLINGTIISHGDSDGGLDQEKHAHVTLEALIDCVPYLWALEKYVHPTGGGHTALFLRASHHTSFSPIIRWPPCQHLSYEHQRCGLLHFASGWVGSCWPVQKIMGAVVLLIHLQDVW